MIRTPRIPILSPFFFQLGEAGLVAGRTFRGLFQRPFEKRNFILQLEDIGVRSLRVVSLTAAFGGLVFGLQAYIGFHKYVGSGTEVYSGGIIAVGLAKELIPILVGLMLAGRVGSSMAAEIGTMKITEQVDALISLGADPHKHLVAPRMLASFIMFPMLTLYGDIVGIFCGFAYNIFGMSVNRVIYFRNALLYTRIWDFGVGLIKAAVFGIVVAIIGSWQGLRAEGGAEGVGRSTTRAVVHASIIILVLNFFLSKALPN